MNKNIFEGVILRGGSDEKAAFKNRLVTASAVLAELIQTKKVEWDELVKKAYEEGLVFDAQIEPLWVKYAEEKAEYDKAYAAWLVETKKWEDQQQDWSGFWGFLTKASASEIPKSKPLMPVEPEAPEEMPRIHKEVPEVYGRPGLGYYSVGPCWYRDRENYVSYKVDEGNYVYVYCPSWRHHQVQSVISMAERHLEAINRDMLPLIDEPGDVVLSRGTVLNLQHIETCLKRLTGM